jgi:LPXTG-motif cell wall-anchored protein
MRKGKNRNSGRSIRLLIVVLSIALVPLISGTAFAQTAAEDQYPGSTGIGLEAADDALKASGAFDPAPSGAAVLAAVSEPQVALAEEEPQADTADTESQADTADTPAITRLPNTGGASPLWLGVLLVVGGLLVHRVARRALDR